MDFLCLLGSGRLARADGPNGFVGDDDVAPLFGSEMEHAAFEFGLANGFLFVGFTLGEALTDTEDDLQAVSQSKVYLFLQDFGSFVVVLAAFAVAEDDVFCTGRLHHFCRNFARIGTAGMVGTVFGGKTDNTVVDNIAHLGQVDEGRADDNIAIGFFGRQNSVQLSGERNTFLQVLVHFPVACYNVLSHCGTLFF